MPDQRDAAAIAADWRAVQRDLQAVKDGPTDPATLHARLSALHAESTGLRDEYEALISEARRLRQSIRAPFSVET